MLIPVAPMGTGLTAGDLTTGETATAFSSNAPTTPAMAIDDSVSNSWTSFNQDIQWWQIQFSQPRKIRQLRLSSAAAQFERMPRDFTLLASNTGAFGGEEATLLTVDESGAYWSALETKTFNFTNDTKYTYYRVHMTDKQDSFGRVAEYYLTEVEMREVPI